MSKTLQQLMMEELGATDPDKAEAVIDVVMDWLKREEKQGNVSMASGWYEHVNGYLRGQENKNGRANR